ncbi:protoporphyrinogen oxidase [Alphaproteobacteria bacterium GH1-50]|uniref:Protoporphyrinogen oxidase n=1 Tax=Kangsaoukella pontilimi TaxID=2691042 RepID=A0A7C9MPP3_9RHOB|nr:flavodoxin domain-containing protein [Kangsaoukella pontilimi]MXQ06657.1 protoporphyrinogen oxidase [Kangsaoukella pontilimi]
MRIAIVFASTEGQTLKISQFIQSELIRAGHQTALLSADAAFDMDLLPYDGVILAASVHVGQYQDSMVEFARHRAVTLNAMPTLFISVSLGAAGNSAEDWEELAAIVGRFTEATGFHPGRVEHVAGAFRYAHYSFVKYWALRWIEAKKDPEAVPGEDKEYTDWDSVAAKVGDWTAGLSAGT